MSSFVPSLIPGITLSQINNSRSYKMLVWEVGSSLAFIGILLIAIQI
jgi:hypothetical protein